jgi:hypothetical protein
MKKYLTKFVFLACMFAAGSCDHNESDEGDYFAFGIYAGFCLKDCAYLYVIKNNTLFEHVNFKFPPQKSVLEDLQKRSQDEYERVKNLPSLLPSAILNEENTTIGCPDCADQGGYYIEIHSRGETRHWQLDTNTNYLPEYLRPFADSLDIKLSSLR